MKMPSSTDQPKVLAGDSMMPGSMGSPPTLIGAVVTAMVSVIAPMPPVAARTAEVPKARPTRISTAFSVSVAATDQNPPRDVSSRIARNAWIENS